MPRAFLLILDSFGIGGAPDAASFGDEGANTLGHICEHMKLRVPQHGVAGAGPGGGALDGAQSAGAEVR